MLVLGRRCPLSWGWDRDVPQGRDRDILQAGAGMEVLSRTEVFPRMELG